MVQIKRDVPIPLYYQLQQHFLERIRGGELRVGDRLPTEEEVAAQTGLSRFTIRQAFQALEREGYVERFRSKGTYVCEPKIPLTVAWQFIGFSEDMERHGHTVETRMLEQQVLPCPTETAEALRIKVDAPIAFLKRFRLLDGHPLMVDLISVPSELVPGVEKQNLEGKSLLRTLRDEFGIRVVSATRTLHIAIPPSWAASLFEIRRNTPVFRVDNVGYDADHTPVYYSKTLVNEHRAEFKFDMVINEANGASSVVTSSAHPTLRSPVRPAG